MEQANTDNPTPRRPQRPMRPLLIAAAVVLALLVGGLVFFAVRAGRAASAAQAQNEQLLIDMAQRDLEREYGQLNDEFATFENQRQLVLDDSVKRELNDKYEAARVQLERLQQELSDTERRSASEVNRLLNSMGTLAKLRRK